MGLAELITLILAICKISGYATLSWLVVFSPMLIIYGIAFLVFMIVLLAQFLK